MDNKPFSSNQYTSGYVYYPEDLTLNNKVNKINEKLIVEKPSGTLSDKIYSKMCGDEENYSNKSQDEINAEIRQMTNEFIEAKAKELKELEGANFLKKKVDEGLTTIIMEKMQELSASSGKLERQEERAMKFALESLRGIQRDN